MVKYLGVTLDHKFLWTTHFENKIVEAKKLLNIMMGTVRQN